MLFKADSNTILVKNSLAVLTLLLTIPFISLPQSWVDDLYNSEAPFNSSVESFDAYWNNREVVKGNGWKQFNRIRWFNESRLYPSLNRIPANQAWTEFNEFKDRYNNQRATIDSNINNWSSLGPDDFTPSNDGHGRINVVVSEPGDPATLYIGSPAGGLWKTQDYGSTWNSLTDKQPVLGVSGIAINPNNTNEIFISTGDGEASDTYSIGVLKSTDGGQTWQTTGFINTITDNRVCRKLSFHPTDENILFLATDNGLYKTSDKGANWIKVMFSSVWDFEFHPTDPDIMYGSSTRIYKSTNGGDSFVQITNGTPLTDVNRIHLAVTPADPDYVYALAGSQSESDFRGLWRSVDSGISFTMMSDSPNIFSYDSDASGLGGQSWYDMALAASPVDADEIYVGAINVWKSVDGGQNWDIKGHWWGDNADYVHADIHYMEYIDGIIHCANDGGLYRSYSNGATWEIMSTGIDIMQFYRFSTSNSNPNLILGGSQDNGTNLLDGNFWMNVQGGDGMDCIIDPVNNNIMYASYYYGDFTKSTNGGNWFSSIGADFNGEQGAWVSPFVMDPQNSSVLYFGLESLWKSTDGGNTVQSIFDSANGNFDQIEVSSVNNSYIFASDGAGLHATTDGGITWNLISMNLPNQVITTIESHYNELNTLYVTLSGYDDGNKVFKTEDLGANWTNISYNLPNLPANSVVLDASSNNHSLYVGMDVGIYYTNDTISDWLLYDLDLPNTIITELEINQSTSKIRACTYGRGIWEAFLYGFSPPPVVGTTEQFSKSHLNIYPLPAKNSLNIEFEARNKAKHVTYQISTVEGRIVKTGSIKAGFSNVDVSKFINGSYWFIVSELDYQEPFVIIGD